MAVTVKRGDTHDTLWTANMDLTGATVRLLARYKKDKTVQVLPTTISDAAAGEVTHTLTGTLAVGVYEIELEVTQGPLVVTFPNGKYETLNVVQDLG